MNEELNRKILKLLEDDARLSATQIAVMLGEDENEVRATIEQLEADGTILGYKALVD